MSTDYRTPVLVPDDAYGSGWNGSAEVPTKNSVYDKIETLVAGGGGTPPYTATIGNGSNTSITVTHNLGTKDVNCVVYEVSSGIEQYPDVIRATTNTLTLIFDTAPTTNQHAVAVWSVGSGGGASDAEDVAFDNTASGLTATDVQAAIDELDATYDALIPAVSFVVSGKADDSAVVHNTGTETIAGAKTFSSDPIVPAETYGSGWNSSNEVPTKNDVYDKVETLSTVYTHNGTSYSAAGGRIFIGSEDPAADGFTLAAGDIWMDNS